MVAEQASLEAVSHDDRSSGQRLKPGQNAQQLLGLVDYVLKCRSTRRTRKRFLATSTTTPFHVDGGLSMFFLFGLVMISYFLGESVNGLTGAAD